MKEKAAQGWCCELAAAFGDIGGLNTFRTIVDNPTAVDCGRPLPHRKSSSLLDQTMKELAFSQV